ncbi:hypothetical protein Tco_0073270 [Tanacetum coccineum]
METDGCIEGWGGIVKWKRARRIQESSERNLWHMQVAKFSTTQPQLMRNQCHANNTIGEMKILLPGQTRKSTLRTNVKLSLVFYNKNNSNRIRQGFSMEQNAHYKYGISGSSRRLYTVVYSGKAVKQSQKLVELEEKFDKLKQEIHTIKEREVQLVDLEDSISSLAKRLDSFSISGKLPSQRNDFQKVILLSPGIAVMPVVVRLSNTCYMGFQYSMENVVDHLTTTGITAIPGERKSIEELEGMSWHLKLPEQTSVRVPSRVAVNERLNRSQYLPSSLITSSSEWFYIALTASFAVESLRCEDSFCEDSRRYSVDQHYREVIRNDNLDEDEEHIIGICLQTPQEEHISYDYDAPPDTTPIEEIAATGWVDELSDDEVTPGKQEFLDEYLTQWDEHLAIQKQELKSEWENPFAAKRGENHTILHLSKEEENNDLPYPKFRNFKQVAAQIIKKYEEYAFPSTSQEESTQSYQPSHDSIMCPLVYPPAQQNP